MDDEAVDEDPVARWIRDEICLYTPDPYGDYPWVATAEELLEMGGEEGPLPAGWPSGPREMHDRLVRMAPALQAKHLFTDLHLEHYYAYSHSPENPAEPLREGYLHVEHGKEEGAAEEEGFWVFVALKPRWRVPQEEIEECVWNRVKYLDEPEDDDDYEWDD